MKTQVTVRHVHSHIHRRSTPTFKMGVRALFLGRSSCCAEVSLNGWENFHAPCLYSSGGLDIYCGPRQHACAVSSVGQYKNGVWQSANGYTEVTNMPLLWVKTLLILHSLCILSLQQTFFDGQLFMLHFVSWFVCPQAQQNLVLGQLKSAVVILVSTAAQQCLTSVSVLSNSGAMLEHDTLIVFDSQQLRDHTWQIK